MNQCRSLRYGALLVTALIGASACGPRNSRSSPITADHSLSAQISGQVHEAHLRTSCIDVKWLVSSLGVLAGTQPLSSRAQIRSAVAGGRTDEVVVVGNDESIAAIQRFIAGSCERSPSDVEVVPLTHATASSVARTVTRSADPGVLIIADDPTNSIVLQGTAGQRDRVRKAVMALDVP